MMATVAGEIALRAAARSLNGMCRKPGVAGSKPFLTLSWPVAAMPASVRP